MKTILVDARKTFITQEGINVDMKKLLDTYKNRKIVVTNATIEEQEKLWIVNMPYEVFSLEHNPDKIDPQYFSTLLDKFSLTPNDVLYFEHNENAVNSARSLGIVAYHYDKDKKNIDELKQFLDKNV